MINEREFLSRKKKTEAIDLRRLVNAVWHIKYWLLLSAAICMAGAWLYIRYSIPVYERSISVVLNDHGNRYDNTFQLISSTLGESAATPIDNQLFLLRSTRLMRHVVDRAFLNVRYFSVGRFIEHEHYTASPIVFSFLPAEGYEEAWVDLRITLTGAERIMVESLLVNGVPVSPPEGGLVPGEMTTIEAGSMSLSLRPEFDITDLHGMWHITRSGKDNTARALASRLVIATAPRQVNVVTISLRDRHPGRAEDVLNLLLEEYNIMAKTYDSQNILNTISFLDERIAGLEDELRAAEGTFTHYRSANELVDVASQSRMAMSNDADYRQQLDELALQESFLDIVRESLTGDGSHRMIPANIGLDDAALNNMIGQYNSLVIDRDRMLAGSSENNPRVQDVTALLATLKTNLIRSVDNLRTAHDLRKQSFGRRLGSNQQELAAMPVKQLALTRMSRDQQVKEPLYILLQQKREEALLMLSSLTDDAYVVDSARGATTPVFPNRREIYALMLIFGLAVPAGFVVLLNLFRNKVLFEKDIIDRTTIPVLGVIPRSPRNRKSPTGAGCVTAAGRDPLTESFRILRSKFQYLNIDKKKPGAFILQITSSGPNEGKSFVSVNMALSLALLGKRVLLVGADLRKPVLGRYLGMSAAQTGLSNYLSGNVKDLRTIITKHKAVPTLEVIRTGAIPFNPGELLGGPLLDEMLDKLRPDYDYIIIDSAPFMVVSDSYTISKIVDSVVYVVRSGFTRLGILERLQNIKNEGNFGSVMIVLNAVDFRRNLLFGGGRQGSGYGYGYGYGYGFGHGASYGYVK